MMTGGKVERQEGIGIEYEKQTGREKSFSGELLCKIIQIKK